MRNINVLEEDDATIQLTWNFPGDTDGCALLTVRGGKDHDLTSRQLRRLAWAALTAATELENERPEGL